MLAGASGSTGQTGASGQTGLTGGFRVWHSILGLSDGMSVGMISYQSFAQRRGGM